MLWNINCNIFTNHVIINIFQNFYAPITAEESVQKPRLCRTAKSIHGPHKVHPPDNGPHQITNEQKRVTKTLSEKFSYMGMRQYSVFRK